MRAFKSIRALTQLAGVLLGFYAMHLGVDLELALMVALAFYVGPEGAERVIMARTKDE